MPVPAGAISRDNTPKAFLSLPSYASSSSNYFPKTLWEHFYLYLPMPVPAGAISRDNTPRAFLSLPMHASASWNYFPRQHCESISSFTYPCQFQQELFPLRQHSESISILTYPCQFQQELFPKTTLREYFYLYLPVPVPAGAISRDNTLRVFLPLPTHASSAGAISLDNTLRAFLSLPTHANSSRSYFPRQHSESISIFTYPC